MKIQLPLTTPLTHTLPLPPTSSQRDLAPLPHHPPPPPSPPTDSKPNNMDLSESLLADPAPASAISQGIHWVPSLLPKANTSIAASCLNVSDGSQWRLGRLRQLIPVELRSLTRRVDRNHVRSRKRISADTPRSRRLTNCLYIGKVSHGMMSGPRWDRLR